MVAAIEPELQTAKRFYALGGIFVGVTAIRRRIQRRTRRPRKSQACDAERQD
jgi:hypothetical protein